MGSLFFSGLKPMLKIVYKLKVILSELLCLKFYYYSYVWILIIIKYMC